MKGITMQVEWKLVEEIKIEGFNPESRTSEENIAKLATSIQNKGFLDVFPILIGKDGFLGDGHRRFMAAKMAGFKEVPTITSTTQTAKELFMLQQNIPPRKIYSSELLEAVRDGRLSLSLCNKNFITQYNGLVKLCGEDALDNIVEKKIGTDILGRLRATLKYIYKYAPYLNTEDYPKKVLLWALHNNEGWRMRTWVTEKGPCGVLINCIEENKPLP